MGSDRRVFEMLMEGLFMERLSLLTKIRRRWNRVIKDRKGQSTTEYILILAIVVMLATKMKGTLSNLLDAKTSKLETDISNF